MSSTTPEPTGLTDQDVDEPDVDEPGVDQPDGSTANREAAGYRRRLRDTEGERDTLAVRVERYQRADVERIAGQRLAVAADVFTVGGVELAALLDADSGDVSPIAVNEAVEQLIRDRPGLEKGAGKRFPDLAQGARHSTATAPTWKDIMKRK